jgi:iron(III) transport system ATP-binding protein
LSGGQQQRVALARALAVEPALLLLDEPLSALDAKVRAGLREEIREVQRRLGIPTIMVTHDQEEALTLADRVVCMNQGRIEQAGTPVELYLRPVTRFVADFMGISNLIAPALLQEHRPGWLAGCPSPSHMLCVRPEKLRIAAGHDGTVTGITYLGNLTRLKLDTNVGPLIAEIPGRADYAIGAAVSINVEPADYAWVKA